MVSFHIDLGWLVYSVGFVFGMVFFGFAGGFGMNRWAMATG
jgi:hypothetical protein